MAIIRSRQPLEKGAAILETALILLPFLVLIFASLEVGRFLNVRQTLTNAAREGARFAVVPASMSSQLPSAEAITSHVETFLGAANLAGAEVQVERPVFVDTGVLQQTFTRVTVTYDYEVISLSMFSDLEIALVGESLMRDETSP